MKVNWTKIIDGLTVAMVGIVLFILTLCVLTLLGFDTLVGMGAMQAMTQGNYWAALALSLGTTGLLTALAFIAFIARRRHLVKVSISFGIVAALVSVIDIYFDGLTADILRYAHFVAIQDLAPIERTTHILFRTLIGGMSSIGEFLGFLIILGLDDLKGFITGIFPSTPPTGRTDPGKKVPPYGGYGRYSTQEELISAMNTAMGKGK